MLSFVKNKVLLLFIAVVSVMFFSCGNQKTDDKQSEKIKSVDTLSDPLTQLTEKIMADSLNADLYNERAKLFIQRNLVNNALHDLHKALELKPFEAKLYITLSDIYLLMGQMQKSLNALKKATELDHDDPEPLLKIAEIYLISKEYPLCFDHIEKAIAIDPVNPRAYFMRGFANKERGDTARAIRFFQITVDQDQNHYEAYNQLGLIYAAKGNHLAIDYFNNAIDINPEIIAARYNLAMYYQESEEYALAINTYLGILDIDSLYTNAYFNLGYIYLVYLEIYETAVEYFSDAIRLNPEYVDAYYNRGYSYELLNNYDEAEKDYRKALEFETNYSKAVKGLNRLDDFRQQ